MEILIATNNPGKFKQIKESLEKYGIKAVLPKDIGIDLNPEETGETMEENATIKVKAFQEAAPDKCIMSDDSGIEIEVLNWQPGVHTRYWRDRKIRMEDEEIINYCLELLKDIPYEKRNARFRSVIALARPGEKEVEIFEGILNGKILEKPLDFRIPGLPFQPIFYIPEWKLSLGEVYMMPESEKANYTTHRELALRELVAKLKNRRGTSRSTAT